MSRRGKRQAAPGLLAWSVGLVLILILAVFSIPAIVAAAPAPAPADAQAATPAATTGSGAAPAAATGVATGPAPVATSGTPGTATATRTPTMTPTPTATMTELQARLALAQTYLAGKDYDNAAMLFAQIVEDTRGNPDALAGLKTALDGRGAVLATQIAPLPTETPVTSPLVTAPTLARTTRSKLIDILATVLAALLAIVLLYLLTAFLRWLLTALRELWYTRILPLLGRPAVGPGFLISDFTNSIGTPAEGASRIVPIAITRKLIAWNQLVQDKQLPVETVPDLDLGSMAWIKVLWSWILPRPRGYRVSGTLLDGPAGQHQLAVQRTDLSRSSVDRSEIFDSPVQPVEEAFRYMAGEAAKWLVAPADIEADRAIALAKGLGETAGRSNSASDIFDKALETLLPVRQQVNQGAVDYADARRRLADAEAMVAKLPTNSDLRAELTRVIADLRTAVPGGLTVAA